MDLWVREARLFKYGSGTGSNFSQVRGEGEPLSGGGRSSGLMSFLKIGDRAAGAIKSGGTTTARRQDGVGRHRPPGHRGLHRLEDARGAEGRRARRRLAARQPAPQRRDARLPRRRHRRRRRLRPRTNARLAARSLPPGRPSCPKTTSSGHPVRRQGYRHIEFPGLRHRLGVGGLLHGLGPERQQLGARHRRVPAAVEADRQWELT